HIRLDILQHFLFQQHRREVKALEGVLLHHAYYGVRKIGANVAKPTADGRRRRSETTLLFGIVECLQGTIDLQVYTCQRHPGAMILVCTEHHAPAFQVCCCFFVLFHHGNKAGSSVRLRCSPNNWSTTGSPNWARTGSSAVVSNTSAGTVPLSSWRAFSPI